MPVAASDRTMLQPPQGSGVGASLAAAWRGAAQSAAPRRTARQLCAYATCSAFAALTLLSLASVTSGHGVSNGSIVADAASKREANKPSALHVALQRLISDASAQAGVALQLSYISPTEEIDVSAGMHQGRPVTTLDTFLFGSGTKPYTAILVAKRCEVDRGIRKLGAADTMVTLFGDPAKNVTIRMLMDMTSGIEDFDFPVFDDPLLLEQARCSVTPVEGDAAVTGEEEDQRGAATGHGRRGGGGVSAGWVGGGGGSAGGCKSALLRAPRLRLSHVAACASQGHMEHSPIEFIRAAAKLGRFACGPPGECSYYSSTNYVLLGLLLLGESRASTWTNLAQSAVLPEGIVDAERTVFANTGNLSSMATIAGSHPEHTMSDSLLSHIGERVTKIDDQDASILGWTCGNMVSTTRQVARFYWSLLGARTLLSPKMLAEMSRVRTLSPPSWSAGKINYGLGLMLQQSSFIKYLQGPPVDGDWGVYLGHGGVTYGFLSEQGWIPQLNATFSITTNDERYLLFRLACDLIQLGAWHSHGMSVLPFMCGDLAIGSIGAILASQGTQNLRA